jgi:hypothetical protein
LETLRKNTEDHRIIRDCLIVNLAWVQKIPIPNIAEDVGVKVGTVKIVLKKMMKPNDFEKRCQKMERKWNNEKIVSRRLD